jgi:hypothetical protein
MGIDQPRRLPADVTLRDFYERLNSMNISYVVLHCLNEPLRALPDQKCDILVDDDHAQIVDQLLIRSQRSRQPIFNIYNIHGVGRYRYNDIALYPPHLAERLLQRAMCDGSGVRVPCPEDQFFSLAFHSLYHLGPRSGLHPCDADGIEPREPGTPYEVGLIRLAHELGLDLGSPVSMPVLHDLLAREGWAPSLDMLDRFGVGNEWCASLARAMYDRAPKLPGLVVFVVRDDIPYSGLRQGVEIEPIVRDHAFIIIATKVLDERERRVARQQLRGANWGPVKGAFRCGRPARIVVAVDPAPLGPAALPKSRHLFGVDNARILQVKHALRSMYDRNVVHASDHVAQAVHYLEVVMPEKKDEVLARACEILGHRRSDVDPAITNVPEGPAPSLRPQAGRAFERIP